MIGLRIIGDYYRSDVINFKELLWFTLGAVVMIYLLSLYYGYINNKTTVKSTDSKEIPFTGSYESTDQLFIPISYNNKKQSLFVRICILAMIFVLIGMPMEKLLAMDIYLF